jgi:hypothetical protein
VEALLLYAMLTTAAYYLGSRAVITEWLWSRYTPKLAKFFDCSACSGFWYGAVAGMTLGWCGEIAPLELPARAPYTPILIGLCSMVWTPITAGIMHLGFGWNGTTVPDDPETSIREAAS